VDRPRSSNNEGAAPPAVGTRVPGWSRPDLAYCSNVHPGADLDAVLGHLAGPLRAVREQRGLARMGAGLWLSARAVEPLIASAAPLREALAASGLNLFTLNGFPQGDFHLARVKEAVYTPAWDDPARLHYTLRLARILTDCLEPSAALGTISTLPLGFAPHWAPARHAVALAHLCALAGELERLADRHGRPIRVCLEPEPGCVLESTTDCLTLFERDLPAAARQARVSEFALANHLGLCYDCCHQAVQFEDPGQSLQRLAAAGVPIGKVQVSCALQVDDPRPEVLAQVGRDFAEPRYLHQVRTLVPATPGPAILHGRMDLPAALADPGFTRDHPWRVHFHVPIHASSLARPGLSTTQPDLHGVLDWLAGSDAAAGGTPHLEVETYTWQVLPPGLRPVDAEGLTAGLAAELRWLEWELDHRGLLRGDPGTETLPNPFPDAP
jgi:sugar phosphate isomerase/epimerase